MTFQFRKAERKQARLRLGISGPSGSGKTASSLLLAYGLTQDWGKIGFIDTENGSGELYAGQTLNGTRIGDYLYGRIEAPFTVQKYLDAIRSFEAAGVELIVIDSLSHAWAGDGGLLDKQGKIADRTGNSFAAWRNVTPEHNALVETMLQSPCHIVATMRAKQEYVQDKDSSGRVTVRKIGLAPVQRDGMEYEFTVFLDVAVDHTSQASKDRTGQLDGQIFKATPKHGQILREWLESGAVASAEEVAPAQQHAEDPLLAELHALWDKLETPPGRREAMLSKPNVNLSSLLDILTTELERRQAAQAAAPAAADATGNVVNFAGRGRSSRPPASGAMKPASERAEQPKATANGEQPKQLF